MFDPRIDKHLIADQGEYIVDEVRKHWAATVSAGLELFAGVVVFVLASVVPVQVWWLPALIGGAITVHAVWRFLEQRMDRFVITNMRVFRVHGILSQRIATMPLARILDISVYKPLIGRIFGYGHFVFESAAQEQGLREIRYVGDPDARGLTIQRVIAQAGLRGAAGRGDPGMMIPVPVQPPPRPQPQGAAGPTRPEAPRDAPATRGGDGGTVATTVYDESRPTAPVPGMERGSAATGWDWLADAQRREDERLAVLRGEPASRAEPFDPDRTNTAPIDLPR